MEKRIINKFGKHYLLGINKDGDYVWLEKESWDCDWYWGFGYLHTYTNNANPERARDIDMHTHFNFFACIYTRSMRRRKKQALGHCSCFGRKRI